MSPSLSKKEQGGSAKVLSKDLQDTSVTSSAKPVENRIHVGGMTVQCPLVGPVLDTLTMQGDWHLSKNAKLADLPSLLCAIHRRDQVDTEIQQSGEAAKNVTLPTTSFSMTSLVTD